jgi:hypothetical protein
MSPRIIHIPLSGGDRKAQAKGIRYAHGIHANHYRPSVLIRSAAEANAIMSAGGPAMPSPRPQAEPTIGKAINGGYDLLEAKCNWCDLVSLAPLRSLKHPSDTQTKAPKSALSCHQRSLITSNASGAVKPYLGDINELSSEVLRGVEPRGSFQEH